MGPECRRRTGNEAVIVFRVSLGFHKRLSASGRATAEVGSTGIQEIVFVRFPDCANLFARSLTPRESTILSLETLRMLLMILFALMMMGISIVRAMHNEIRF